MSTRAVTLAIRTLAARALVSAALTGAMLWFYDWRQVLENLAQLSPWFVAFAWAFYAACQWLSAYRWGVLLRAKGVDLATGPLFILYMMGMFANNFMPGGLGGDAVKAYSLYRRSGAAGISVASVFVERFCGLLALSLLGAVACVVLLVRAEAEFVASLVLAGVFAFMAGAVAAWSVTVGAVLRMLLRSVAPETVRRRVALVMDTVHSFRQHRAALAWALGVSVLLQGMIATYYYFVGAALGAPVPLIYFFLFLPIITVITLVPISLGGLGVRELAMVYLFGTIGVSSESVLSISLTAHVLNMALSLSGGVLLLTRRVWPPARASVPARTPALRGMPGP